MTRTSSERERERNRSIPRDLLFPGISLLVGGSVDFCVGARDWHKIFHQFSIVISRTYFSFFPRSSPRERKITRKEFSSRLVHKIIIITIFLFYFDKRSDRDPCQIGHFSSSSKDRCRLISPRESHTVTRRRL